MLYKTVILPIRPSLQPTTYDCGPASLQMILASLGKSMSQAGLGRLLGTNPDIGTRPRSMVRVLKRLRIRHAVKHPASLHDVEMYVRMPSLCLIHYMAWASVGKRDEFDTGHWSVIFGFNRTHFLVADPLQRRTKRNLHEGIRSIRKDILDKKWHGTFPDGTKTNHWMVAVPLVQ